MIVFCNARCSCAFIIVSSTLARRASRPGAGRPHTAPSARRQVSARHSHKQWYIVRSAHDACIHHAPCRDGATLSRLCRARVGASRTSHVLPAVCSRVASMHVRTRHVHSTRRARCATVQLECVLAECAWPRMEGRGTTEAPPRHQPRHCRRRSPDHSCALFDYACAGAPSIDRHVAIGPPTRQPTPRRLGVESACWASGRAAAAGLQEAAEGRGGAGGALAEEGGSTSREASRLSASGEPGASGPVMQRRAAAAHDDDDDAAHAGRTAAARVRLGRYCRAVCCLLSLPLSADRAARGRAEESGLAASPAARDRICCRPRCS